MVHRQLKDHRADAQGGRGGASAARNTAGAEMTEYRAFWCSMKSDTRSRVLPPFAHRRCVLRKAAAIFAACSGANVSKIPTSSAAMQPDFARRTKSACGGIAVYIENCYGNAMNAVDRTPVTRRQALDFDGFRVERVQIRGGIFPANRARQLRIIATLGAGWELRVEKRPALALRSRRAGAAALVVATPVVLSQSGDNLLITIEASLVERMAREIGLTEAESALPFQKLTDPTVYRLIGRWPRSSLRTARVAHDASAGGAVLGHICAGA